MSSVVERLIEIGLQLPQPPAPFAAYESFVITGHTLYVSGQISANADGTLLTGRVASEVAGEQKDDSEVSIADAKVASRQALLLLLAQAQTAVGLDNIAKVVKITVFVNSNPKLTRLPEIGNAASEVLLKVFPDKVGAHARCAIGVATLPLGATVEIDGIFEIKH
eukprot:GILI01025314.1.p1 GENE.GILI01025314.1~~GILI01025314.1.p1  ORF type:complete len:165 (+),score=31.83 GILI01025314.1:79-573(+)